MLPSIPRPEDYDVSTSHGFLPQDLPLERLPDPYYAPWESVVASLQSLILARRLRGVVDRLPVLSTARLRTKAEWQRAYVVLAFLTNAYIWSGERPAEIVPRPISRPFIEISKELELPSISSYASTVLWNWKPIFLDEPVDNVDNMASLHTFTGSLDESWFYIVSAAIEARAAPVIPIMLEAIRAARNGYSADVVACLQAFAERLDELATLLERMYEHCDPYVFYNRIRPFLAGSKNMSDAGLPRGVMFDESGTQEHDYVQLGGGSAAQSSVIQFFDIVLGVSHHPTGHGPPSGQTRPHAGPPPTNFIHEMRKYMPGPHRRFLERVGEVANIRDFVESRRDDRALTTAYDACLAMLRELRDRHIRLVSRYIVVKSHEAQRRQKEAGAADSTKRPLNLANVQSSSSSSATSDAPVQKRSLRGTGGTALIPFLKQAREETGEPAIGSWARRIMSNGPSTLLFTASDLHDEASGDGEANRRHQQKSLIVGLSGSWTLDDSEGGICHW